MAAEGKQPKRTVREQSCCTFSLFLLDIPVAVASQEITQLARGFLLRDSAALLGFSEDLVASSRGRTQRIAGQFTPGLVQPSRKLPADARELFSVHPDLPLRLMRHVNRRSCIRRTFWSPPC